MAREIIWIHDKALNSFLVQAINDKAKAIFVWDDEYFKTRSYSLKRLVFIYETLCQMPVDVIKGQTIEIIRSLSPSKITTLYVADTKIKEIIQHLTKNFDVEVVRSHPFVKIPDGYEFRRFFKYWDKAKKTAFLRNGGEDA
ncbi:MAG: hypothetical protein SFW07_07095 [Gammaproteobacteria bacterium]|nr:hypothetical protein [Gammaproteobacteria bacterium]